MEKKFLDINFKFCGKIGTIKEPLDETKANYCGVYMFVLPDDFGKIEFKEHSTSGRWKGKNPDVSIEELKCNWVTDAKILYIGKSSSKPVRERIENEHKRFWNEENVPGWGGRYIGQLQNYEKLEVWSLECDNSGEVKDKLLKDFKKQYKKLPFANLKG